MDIEAHLEKTKIDNESHLEKTKIDSSSLDESS